MIVSAKQDDVRAETANVPSPVHVAIIMDGNGRWATSRNLKRTEGHKEGAAAARRAVEAARDLNMKYLTLYSFSTENWSRPVSEIRDLMGLLRKFIGDDLPTLKREGVKITVLGDKTNLSPDIAMLVNRAEADTRNNSSFHLQIAFNYGGRDEIIRAARKLAERASNGEITPSEIDEELFSFGLDTRGIPDPDLVIRTSGEKRISNFLLWQAAYAEYVFLDTLWPDFSINDLQRAVEEFRSRERRFGGVGSSS